MTTKTKDKDAEPKPWDEIAIGDQVKHAQWGVGTVLFRSGSGELAKAIVVFPEEGQKKLMLKYAKLKKVGSAPKSEVAAKIKAAVAAEKAAAIEEEEVEAKPIMPQDEEALPPPEGDEPDIFEEDEEDRFAEREEEDRGGDE